MGKPEARIWFIFGPSGSGKSHFSKFLATQHGWLHIELDRFSEGNGVDLEGLREEWDHFFKKADAELLVEELERRAEDVGKSDIVVSFPGNLVRQLNPAHISTLRKRVLPIILVGEPEHCLGAFLKREVESERGLQADHWHLYNDQLFATFEKEHLIRWKVDVFDQAGRFKSEPEILALAQNLDVR